MSDDLGDVGDFDAPTTTVERFLSQNPQYGEQVAETLKQSCEIKGKQLGQLIQKKLNKMGHDLSDSCGTMIMNATEQALKTNLPNYVDKSDIEIMEEDDVTMNAQADTMMYFMEAMLPYVVSAALELAEGLDWGFPFSVAELLRERYPDFPTPPRD
jgi:histidine ammonia-lyase